MRARFLAILLGLALAGCVEAPTVADGADPTPTMSPVATGTTGTTGSTGTQADGTCVGPKPSASGNAPLLSPFTGSKDDVRTRVASALGDNGSGTIEVYTDPETGRATAIWYEADRIWPSLDENQATAVLTDYLEDLGAMNVAINISFASATAGVSELKPRIMQIFDGGEVPVLSVDTLHVDNDAAKYDRVGGSVGPFYDLSNAAADVTAEAAFEEAARQAACQGINKDAVPQTEFLTVSNESLAWQISILYPIEGHHCGGDRYVYYIDAMTLRVHSWLQEPCF